MKMFQKIADLCDFLRNAGMHMKKKKRNKDFKRTCNHIDRLSTDVRYDMVCGIIFSRDFTFQISSFRTRRAKTCEIIHLSYDEVSD